MDHDVMDDTRCGVVELRQYTLHPGRRDTLIRLFEAELVESQEAMGMRLLGQFRDLDDPDRFVWLRGFRDMMVRPAALGAFYGGPVWRAHREAANATMIDSDNVLLLRPAGRALPFTNGPRSRAGGSLIVATICSLAEPPRAFRRFFEDRLRPVLDATRGSPIASFETEPAENNFPALPVRTGETVFVWLARFPDPIAYDEHWDRVTRSPAWRAALWEHLSEPPQPLRLQPTPCSVLC